MQKLVIRNFGPILDATLEVSRLTIFIGPQASGKSTLAKAVYFFKSLRDELLNFVMEHNGQERGSIQDFAKLVRGRFMDFWGGAIHHENMYLAYSYGQDVTLEITAAKGTKYVDPQFSQAFEKRFDEITAFVGGNRRENFAPDAFDKWDEQNFRRQLAERVNGLFGFDHQLFFIPAARGLVTTLSDQLAKLEHQNLDDTMRGFIDQVIRARRFFSKPIKEIIEERHQLSNADIDFEVVKLAENIIERVIKGTYIADRDQEKLFFDGDRFTQLKHASSGQQEAIWITYLAFLYILENRRVFVVFEEPEAHLYPEAQRDMVQLIALLLSRDGNAGMVTTHSPYILAALNNHLYAHRLGQRQTEAVGRLMPASLWLDPSAVHAFFVDKGGLDNIMDGDLLQIKSEAVDTASTVINEEYDALFELDESP